MNNFDSGIGISLLYALKNLERNICRRNSLCCCSYNIIRWHQPMRIRKHVTILNNLVRYHIKFNQIYGESVNNFLNIIFSIYIHTCRVSRWKRWQTLYEYYGLYMSRMGQNACMLLLNSLKSLLGHKQKCGNTDNY